MEGMLQERVKIEMKAYAYNAMAYYFYQLNKRTASLAHTNLANRLHRKIGNYNYVAISLLHTACIQIRQNHLKEAHKVRK